ncbi:hypothetical protein NB689_003476 [Xanthomonas sacchari]|nr:hypothetical protein [Xanthomonas sacchari]
MPSRWISRTSSTVAISCSCTWRSVSMSITARWLARAVSTEACRSRSALRRMMSLVASSMALDSAAAFCCSCSDSWIANWRFHDGMVMSRTVLNFSISCSALAWISRIIGSACSAACCITCRSPTRLSSRRRAVSISARWPRACGSSWPASARCCCCSSARRSLPAATCRPSSRRSACTIWCMRSNSPTRWPRLACCAPTSRSSCSICRLVSLNFCTSSSLDARRRSIRPPISGTRERSPSWSSLSARAIRTTSPSLSPLASRSRLRT